MKKKHALSERYFLEIFFAAFAGFFMVASVFMPDRATMFSGLWKIMSSPCKSPTSYFAVGGLAATFLNMGLVALAMTALYHFSGTKVNNVATLAFLLTLGFCSWGITLKRKIFSTNRGTVRNIKGLTSAIALSRRAGIGFSVKTFI